MAGTSTQPKRFLFRVRQAMSVPFDRLDQWAQWIGYWFRLAKAFGHDYFRYAKHGPRPYSVRNRDQLKAIVTMDYHVLEKGMSLKNPRPGYGQAAAKRLVQDAEEYVTRFGGDWLAGVVVNVLHAYGDFNRSHGQDLPEIQVGIDRIQACLTESNASDQGGARRLSREEVLRDARIDLRRFFNSRFSIRNFAPGPVDPQLIEQAVSMARKTPSVCNRQSWKAYVYSDLETKNRLLELQNGHRGFGEHIATLLVLTADLQAFVTIEERNQAWVDGGMFGMSLIYALHSLGLGTCGLNLCHGPAVERAIKVAGRIPDSEVLLMMVAVGHLPDSFTAAFSTRKPIGEVFVHRAPSG